MNLYNEQKEIRKLQQNLNYCWQQVDGLWADKMKDEFFYQYIEPIQDQMILFSKELEQLVDIVEKIPQKI